MGVELSYHKSARNSSVIEKINYIHIDAIRKAYYNIKSCRLSAGHVDKNTFLHCLDLEETIGDKIFTAFDCDKTGLINWRECLSGLSLCVNGSLREKSTALFKLNKISSPDKGVTPAVLQGILKKSLDAAL
uniref:EF-hand calcium-binding domain-containing protein 1-like n=1 Tax=Saccoglossus kowalevskii TaxID=10224 RepID=A0ABM0MB82_SACKO